MPEQMTLDAIRDELAMMAGWEIDPNRVWFKEGCVCCVEKWDEHPIPPTLDEAAKLPEGWRWRRWNGDWMAHNAASENGYLSAQTVPDTGSELYDRFALRLACERAEREAR